LPSYPRLLTLGDTGWTVEFGDAIEPALHDRVLALCDAVAALHLDGVIETVPTYRSATVYFDPCRIEAVEVGHKLQALAATLSVSSGPAARIVDLPVCYAEECGPDLPEVAAAAGLSTDEVIRLHASVEYRVYMLGFSPGFPYLGSVPEAIAVSRLPTPRPAVPAGSVGLAGRQTGIYPQQTPGGWRLIGRTPVTLYAPHHVPPFLLRAGDRVRFVPIDRQEFDRLQQAGGWL
jgi:inhibitor of KinA